MAVFLDIGGGSNNDSNSVGWIKSPYGLRLVESPDLDYSSVLDYFKDITGSKDDKFTNVSNPEFGVLDGEPDKSALSWFETFFSVDEQATNNNAMRVSTNDLIGSKNPYTLPTYADTRVGGQEAINPLWQFNRDDDITPPSFYLDDLERNRFWTRRGMGRVYAEKYYARQRILWLQVGVQRYKNLLSFIWDANDSSATDYVREGGIGLTNAASFCVKKIFKMCVWCITFPVAAPFMIWDWLSTYGYNEISGYIRFEPRMTSYYEYINSMLSYLSVGMGIYPQVKLNDKTIYTNKGDKSKDADEDIIDKSPATGAKKLGLVNSTSGLTETMVPDIIKEGPDIFKILNRRAKLYLEATDTSEEEYINLSTRDLTLDEVNEKGDHKYWTESKVQYRDENGELLDVNEEGIAGGGIDIGKYLKKIGTKIENLGKSFRATKFCQSMMGSLYGTNTFIGFRVDQNSTTTESFSNSTSSVGVFEDLNSISKQNRSSLTNFAGSRTIKIAWELMKEGNNEGGVQAAFKNAIKKINTAVGFKLLDKVGFSLGDAIYNGDGYFEIPEVWSDSSYEKSYSFDIKLRARYGDPISIFQCCYLPMCCMLAATAPRSIGNGTYGSPFSIKAFCQGMYHVPLGIITNLSITRGRDRLGWTLSNLPTAIDMNVQIKDLSPQLFLGIQEIGFSDIWKDVNRNMMNYLDTLSGIDIYHALYGRARFSRTWLAACLIKKNTLFSPIYWGNWLGNSKLGVAINTFMPSFITKQQIDAKIQNLKNK